MQEGEIDTLRRQTHWARSRFRTGLARSGSAARRLGWACGLLCFWAAGYFGAPLFIAQTAAFDQSLPLDGRIPCIPAFFWVYVLGWAVPFAAALLLPWHLFYRAALAYAVLIAAATLLFVYFPTDSSVLRAQCPTAPALRMLYSIDVSSNVFPSLHVAFSTLTALCLRTAQSRGTALFFGITCTQVAAVCFVKQHYIADAAAGALLAWLVHSIAFGMPLRLKSGLGTQL